jgi:hypothetical protein
MGALRVLGIILLIIGILLFFGPIVLLLIGGALFGGAGAFFGGIIGLGIFFVTWLPGIICIAIGAWLYKKD